MQLSTNPAMQGGGEEVWPGPDSASWRRGGTAWSQPDRVGLSNFAVQKEWQF